MSIDLDTTRLAAWLKTHHPEIAPITAIIKFPGGQSNPTYRLSTERGDLVLRRKPFGTLLPSAHAIDREHRMLSALHPVGFAVPRPVALCLDAGVVGAAFYLMEAVEGRTFWSGKLPDQSPAERRAIYESAVTTLASLHSIQPEAVGLEDFGRPGNYFSRQVSRWTRQYRAAQTDTIDTVERLIEWLERTTPEQGRTSIVHGDFRLDNLLIAKHSSAVLAVIDWELSTIGDPLADFSYFAMNWTMSSDGPWIGDADFAALGIPTLDEIVNIYCEKTSRDALPDLHWYFAFNLFRLTIINQGIKKRALDGNASSANAGDVAGRIEHLAESAWTQACLAGAG